MSAQHTSVQAIVPAPWEPSGVRITGIRPLLTAPEGTVLTVVKVETSEPGLYGWGCASFQERPLAVATAVSEYLEPFLVGRDPADIEDIWQSSYLSSYWRSGPVLGCALSGVDQALWDIKGKLADMPVHQLLGGKARKAASVYGHASGADFDQVEDSARGFVERGFRHVRCQVGVPGSSTYGVSTDDRPSADAPIPLWDATAYCRRVPALFEHMRGALGDEIELLHDVHERVSPVQTVNLAKTLEPYNLFFVEDPLAPEDVEHFRILRQQAATPIAMGELFVNPAEYVPLIRERLIDFIRIRVPRIGGLTPARKVAAFCELSGVRTAWQAPGNLSPVGHAANLALDLSCSNFGVQESHDFNDAAHEVFPGCPEIRDGMLWSNERPGLGIDVDEDAAARFPPSGRRVHRARARQPDGTVQRP